MRVYFWELLAAKQLTTLSGLTGKYCLSKQSPGEIITICDFYLRLGGNCRISVLTIFTSRYRTLRMLLKTCSLCYQREQASALRILKSLLRSRKRNCSLFGRDNDLSQISEHIFSSDGSYCLHVIESKQRATDLFSYKVLYVHVQMFLLQLLSHRKQGFTPYDLHFAVTKHFL